MLFCEIEAATNLLTWVVDENLRRLCARSGDLVQLRRNNASDLLALVDPKYYEMRRQSLTCNKSLYQSENQKVDWLTSRYSCLTYFVNFHQANKITIQLLS